MEIEHESLEWMREESKARCNSEICYLIEELTNNKISQRLLEEQVLERLTKPIHKKWIHEHIMDQYKHEKLLKDIGRRYCNKEIKAEEQKAAGKIQGRIAYEIEKRLEDTYGNIQLINSILASIDEFKMYRMLSSIMLDEQVYANKLTYILHS